LLLEAGAEDTLSMFGSVLKNFELTVVRSGTHEEVAELLVVDLEVRARYLCMQREV